VTAPPRSRLGQSGSGAVRTGVVAGVALLACMVLAALVPAQVAAPLILLIALATVFRHRISSPSGLLAILVLTVMWVPAGRYSLIGVAPALPWRLVTVVLLLMVFLALALDRRVSWQRSPFLLLVLGLPAVGLISSVANLHALAVLGRVEAAILANTQMFLLAGIFVIARQLLTSSWRADWLCRLLVLTGGAVGVAACWERVSGFNVFLNLQRFLPLQLLSEAPQVARFGVARALGSANHPIALSVALIMLVPVAVFLARHSPWPRRPGVRQGLYYVAAVAMVLGSFVTGSRTFVVMLAVMAVFLLVNHWTAFVRVLLVAVPLVLVGALALPGSVGSLLMNFLQPDELIASQYASPGSRGSGRLADLGPSLAAAQAHLPFGTGVGSRVVSGEGVNAPILDDQYLSTLLESGLLGLIAMVALLLTPVVVLLKRTRDPYLHGPERDLALALSCAFAGYAVAEHGAPAPERELTGAR